MSSLKRVYETYRTAMIIGAAIGGALVVYLIIVEVFKSSRAPADPLEDRSQFELIQLVFYVVALAQFVTISLVRGMILRVSGPQPVEALLARLTRANIITLALCELPAVLGLVLFFIAGSSFDFYLLFGLSMLMLFFYFPRYHRWKNWVQEKSGRHWQDANGSSA